MDYYEAQAFQFRNQPGLSIADARFIDAWVPRARAQDDQRMRKWVADLRRRDKAKAIEVLDRINRLQDDYVAVRKRAERNEAPWRDLAKIQRRLNHERVTLEKVLESLEASEASRVRMESDPTAYYSEFYNRFPALNDKRPNLSIDLAEDRARRGVAAL